MRVGSSAARLARPLVALAALLLGRAAWAQGRSVLSADFPVDLLSPPGVDAFTGVVRPGYLPRIPDGAAAEALRSEALWVFGAMVWGLDYVYTPSDRARAIEERFEARPRWQEPADLSLRVVSTRLEGSVVVASVECVLDGAQAREAAAWRTTGSASQARGAAPYARPGAAPEAAIEARREAVLVACKEALRAYLRELTHNKPREVRGSFALASAPSLALRSGSWIATVRVHARVEAIEGYGAY